MPRDCVTMCIYIDGIHIKLTKKVRYFFSDGGGARNVQNELEKYINILIQIFC